MQGQKYIWSVTARLYKSRYRALITSFDRVTSDVWANQSTKGIIYLPKHVFTEGAFPQFLPIIMSPMTSVRVGIVLSRCLTVLPLKNGLSSRINIQLHAAEETHTVSQSEWTDFREGALIQKHRTACDVWKVKDAEYCRQLPKMISIIILMKG